MNNSLKQRLCSEVVRGTRPIFVETASSTQKKEGVAMRQTTRVGLVIRGTLAGLALAIWCGSAFAQGSGGGPASTGGMTATSSSSSSASNLAFSSTAGGTANSTNPISKNNPFATYYSSPMTSGYGPNFVLKPTSTVQL